jgi:hypothetical protein
MPAIQQGRDGALVDGLETVERTVAISSRELAQRPETLRVCGELRVEFRQTELAAVDFRESIGLARSLECEIPGTPFNDVSRRLLDTTGPPRRSARRSLTAQFRDLEIRCYG